MAASKDHLSATQIAMPARFQAFTTLPRRILLKPASILTKPVHEIPSLGLKPGAKENLVGAAPCCAVRLDAPFGEERPIAHELGVQVLSGLGLEHIPVQPVAVAVNLSPVAVLPSQGVEPEWLAVLMLGVKPEAFNQFSTLAAAILGETSAAVWIDQRNLSGRDLLARQMAR